MRKVGVFSVEKERLCASLPLNFSDKAIFREVVVDQNENYGCVHELDDPHFGEC